MVYNKYEVRTLSNSETCVRGLKKKLKVFSPLTGDVGISSVCIVIMICTKKNTAAQAAQAAHRSSRQNLH